MSLLGNFKELKKDELFEIDYEISSAAYFQNEISKLVEKSGVIQNDYIFEKFSSSKFQIYKYRPIYFKKFFFDKDPKNKHDKNAIKIIASAGMTSLQIGFIPADSNIQFSKLKKEGKIYNVNLYITGGPKKIYDNYCIKIINEPYYVHLNILFKKK
ncbi:hypothetical protein H6A09_01530 [[Clostridium] spiroforme]|nr:hypothetical protein [Thomasclavelia spiroformis]